MLHQIGSGVLGPVFRTYDPQQDRLVAVKAFRLDVVPEVVAKLADALRKLPAHGPSHPAIVPVLDAGLEGMSAYLAMEYVTAETLDVALRHLAPAPLDRVVPIIDELAAAVDAAWAAGYGHGALHPRDIFVVSGTHEVRVTGFGIGPALESVGIKVPPRRPYAAPERGTGDLWNIRADIYSLGVLAHELLTKRRPGGANEQDGSLVTGTSPEARVLIRRVLAAALADKPEHRFATASAFAGALAAIAKGEPLGQLPEGAALGDEKPAPPKKAEAAAAPLLAISEAPSAPPPPLATPSASAGQIITRADEPDTPFPVEPVRPAPVVPTTPSRPFASAHEPRPPIPARERPAPTPRPSPPPMRVSAPPVIIATPASFPWVALVSATVASAALAGVVGYRIGVSRHPAPGTEVALQQPPPGTDVVVAPPLAAKPESKPLGPPSLAAPTPGPPSPAATTGQSQATSRAPKSAPATRPRQDVTTGSMVVETRPTGARVVVDGRAVGVTPLTMPDMKAGSHPMRLEMAGYKTLVTSVVIRAGERSRVAVTLELSGVPGSWMPSSR